MRERVLCPRHQEETPSCVVYDTTAYCFGCNTNIPLEELGLTPDYSRPKEPPEDLVKSLAKIDALPRALVRGFNLPIDENGYYLVWPERNYYKYRKFINSEPKYVGPKGHKTPLYQIKVKGCDSCVVIEGEFNALSLTRVTVPSDIISPGSAGHFYGKDSETLLQFLRNYRKVFIIVDEDGPGVKAAIQLKVKLVAQGQPYTYISLWPKDANDILVQDGEEKLEERVRESLGLS